MEKLPKRIHENGIDYILVGDYYLPALRLSEESCHIGFWGRMHKEFLKEYRPTRYNSLLLSGKLDTYLSALNEQAEIRLEVIMDRMQIAEGVNEALKDRDQFLWVQKMNSIHNRAEEIIRNELIYA